MLTVMVFKNVIRLQQMKPLCTSGFTLAALASSLCPQETKCVCLMWEKTSGTQGIIYQVLSVISDLDCNKTTDSS